MMMFMASVDQLARHPKTYPDQAMEIVLPRFIQVLMTGGDRYLAANIGVVRSLLNPNPDDSQEHFSAQAKVQEDVAWLNPRHEDNYYLAAAMLSSSGHARVAEEILQKAADSRPFDSLAPFFLGFDYYHYDHDPILGARWLYVAASRAGEQNRISFSRIAARWAEKGQDTAAALAMVRVMRDQARGGGLKRYLDARIQRLEGLRALEEAAHRYAERVGTPAQNMDQLVRSGDLASLPTDPLGLGYEIDPKGLPHLKSPLGGTVQMQRQPGK
ncbi:MAG: hypothetical protein EKK46_04210 [Rhodocyclaceae bacterium]|nr:MAG: hypothetical protein EKK46_04210 [Rhodocyclaceae bacterium]